jgi:hypothetical protein
VLDNESHPIPPTQQLFGSALREIEKLYGEKVVKDNTRSGLTGPDGVFDETGQVAQELGTHIVEFKSTTKEWTDEVADQMRSDIARQADNWRESGRFDPDDSVRGFGIDKDGNMHDLGLATPGDDVGNLR